MNDSPDIRAGEFFHRFADTFDSLYEGRRGPLMRFLDARLRRDIAERFRLTFEGLGPLEGLSVLDIGCGSGVYAREALARGAARVSCIDPAPRMLELTRARLGNAGFAGRYELSTGLFPDARPAGRFDRAIVMGVLDYVADPVAFLRVLREVCDGRVALSFPSSHWLRGPLRQVRYRLRDCPLFLYSPARVAAVLADAGYRQVRIEKIAGAGQDFHVIAGA